MPLSIELNYMKSSHYFFFSLGLVKQTYSENLDTFVGRKKNKTYFFISPPLGLYVYYNGTDVSLLSCITDIKHIVHLTNFISYINSAL